MPPIRVMIAAPTRARREVCRGLLAGQHDIRVVGTAGSRPAVLRAVRDLEPRILLLDERLWRGDPPTLPPLVRGASARTHIILLLDRTSEAGILDALQQGVRGYLHRNDEPALLPQVIRGVHRGEAWVSRKLVARILDRLLRLTAGDLAADLRLRSRGPRSNRPLPSRSVQF